MDRAKGRKHNAENEQYVEGECMHQVNIVLSPSYQELNISSKILSLHMCVLLHSITPFGICVSIYRVIFFE